VRQLLLDGIEEHITMRFALPPPPPAGGRSFD
jgi:hypothetical protein